MRVVKISNHLVGHGHPAFLIAEIGSNHNQDYGLALETIDAAAEAGAQAVKFQSLQIKKLYHNPSDKIKALHRRIDLEETWYPGLMEHARKRGVLFFSSPTYLDSVDLLEEMGVAFYKLASAQAGTFPQIIKKVAETGKPVFFSTGLLTGGYQIENVIGIFKKVNNENYSILHCNSIYPTPYDKVNLPLIKKYRETYGCPVGFSDHTQGPYAAYAAVAKGAAAIEKHFILDKRLQTPDAQFSSTPDEFRLMAEGIRHIEQALKPHPRDHLETAEKDFREKVKYRLILANSKSSGELFYPGDFEYKRHPDGINCDQEQIVINKKQACINMNKGEVLNWDMLEDRQ